MVDRDKTADYYAYEYGTVEVDLANKDEEGNALYDGAFWGMGDYKIPVIRYSPELIFANKVPILNANFLRPGDTNENTQNPEDNMTALRNTVAGWYVAIRMISIIGLLSVLVYLAIRMMLSGVAADKAKYKKMLMNWLVAMCLLFFLHYLMSFIMTLSETITGLISSSSDTSLAVNVGNGETMFSTNMIGLMRFQVQHTDTMMRITYMIIYLMMVGYTIKFTWVYLKRMVIMAFLTLISPLIALTYPIDKVGDGQAQAFNMWMKEYLYNALLQPLHCLIYTIFSTATISLATTNPLIAIVIFPCMGYAEKFLKSLLGFSKANGGTMPSLAGAVGAHAVGSIIGNFAKRGRAGVDGGKQKPRMKDSPKDSGITLGAPDDLDDNDDYIDGVSFDGVSSPVTSSYSGSREGSQNNQQGNNGGNGNDGNQDRNDMPGGDSNNQEPNPGDELYMRGMKAILDDPYATEEEKAYAQEQIDDYNERMRQQQAQWAAGNDEEDGELPEGQVRTADNGEALGESAELLEGETLSAKADVVSSAEDKDDKKDKKEISTIRGVKSAVKPLVYKGGKGILKGIARAGAAGLKTGAAIPFAAAAFAAGAVATGDLSQATTLAGTAFGGAYYGAGKLAGKAGGNAIGKVAGEKLEDFENKHGLSTDYKSAYQRGKYGSEIAAQNAKEQREFEYSEEFNQYIRGKYGKKTKEEQEKARQAILEYHKLGVKDIKQADKLYKTEAQMRKQVKAIGGKEASRREMVSAMKAEARTDVRAWTDDKVYNRVKDSYIKRYKGTDEQKNTKATRKMELARIIHDNK